MQARLVAATLAAILAAGCGGGTSSSSGGGDQRPQDQRGPTVTYPGSTATVALGASTDRAALAKNIWSIVKTFGEQGTDFAPEARGFFGPTSRLQEGTFPCGTGSFTCAMKRQSGDPAKPTPGDWLEVRYAGCGANVSALYGSIRVTLDAATTDDFAVAPSSITTSRSFAVTAVWSDYAATSANQITGLDGQVTDAFSADVPAGRLTMVRSGPSLVSVLTSGSLDASYTLLPLPGRAAFEQRETAVHTGLGTADAAIVSRTIGFDARICEAGLGGCANVEVGPDFRFDLDPYFLQIGAHVLANTPTSGAFKVFDDQGNSVTVTAGGTTAGSCTLRWSIGGQTGSEACDWSAL